MYDIAMYIYRRPLEPSHNDLTAGLLWSDPVKKDGTATSPRGIGILFGPDVTSQFLGEYLRCHYVII